ARYACGDSCSIRIVLAVACTNCGAPCRVSLKTPDRLACVRCGWSGAPSADALPKIQAAAAIVARSDARTRQLRGVSRMLAERGARYYGLFILVTGLSMQWSAYAVWMGQGGGIEGARYLLP